MKEEKDLSVPEQSQEESRFKKYLRTTILVLSLILLLAVIVSAIMRKFGT